MSIYATVEEVEALNRSRTLGVGTNPTEEDVKLFLEQSAAEIDGLVSQKGYAIPIPTSATTAFNTLKAINAEGGLAKMEESSPSSSIKIDARNAYNKSLKMLESAEAIVGAPKDVDRVKPRGPGLTRPPTTALGNTPYFSRGMGPGPDEMMS